MHVYAKWKRKCVAEMNPSDFGTYTEKGISGLCTVPQGIFAQFFFFSYLTY